jgi:hypothetical protein
MGTNAASNNIKTGRFLTQIFFVKTAFYGLNAELEPEAEP